MKRMARLVGVLGLILLAVSAVSVEARDRVVIVTGVAGDKKHYEQYQKMGSGLHSAFSNRFGYGERVHWLSETPGQSELSDTRSDSAGVRRVFSSLSEQATDSDRLILVLIGHANADGQQWRLNLPGDDLTARQWKQLMDSYPGRVGAIVSAPFSREVVPIWSSAGRPIVTSSRSDQKNHWMFRRALRSVLMGKQVEGREMRPEPRNLPVMAPSGSMYDFFDSLARFMEQYRGSQGYLQDEHPALDDNGDGIATEATEFLNADDELADGEQARTFPMAPSDGAGTTTATARPDTSAEPVPERIRSLMEDTAAVSSDAVVLVRDIEGSLNNDLSATWEYHVAIQILNESGRRHANVQKRFYPWKDVELQQARTITPDGEVLPVDTHAVLKRSGSSGENDTDPTNPTQLTLHFSNPKPGSVIEYRYTVTDRNFSIGGEYTGEINVQSHLPIRQSRLTFRYPESMTIKTVPWFSPALDVDTSLERSREAYTKIVRFRGNSLPAIRPEPAADPPHLRMGKLVFSSIDSWDRIARWYHYLSRASRQSSPEVKKLAKRLTEPDSGRMEKAKALYEWVSEEIRYVAIPLGVHGYKPRMVPNMMKWRYGDCKDKASLLMTLLDEVGVESKMVLIGAGMGDMVAEAPRKTAFNHAIVALPMEDGEYFFMDATAEQSPFGTLPPMDQGRQTLVIEGDEGKIVRTPYDPADSNTLKIDRQIRVDGADLVVDERRESRGRWALERRTLLRKAGKAQARRTVKNRYGERYGSVTFQSYDVQRLGDINTPLVETIQYRIPGAARGSLSLPWTSTPLDNVTPVSNRQSEVSLGSTLNLQETNQVMNVAVETQQTVENNELGRAEFTVEPTENGIQARRELRVEQARAPASDYPQLVELSRVKPHPLSLSTETTTTSRSVPAYMWYVILGTGGAFLIIGLGIGAIVARQS